MIPLRIKGKIRYGRFPTQNGVCRSEKSVIADVSQPRYATPPVQKGELKGVFLGRKRLDDFRHKEFTADDAEQRFDERMKKLVKHKSAEKPE